MEYADYMEHIIFTVLGNSLALRNQQHIHRIDSMTLNRRMHRLHLSVSRKLFMWAQKQPKNRLDHVLNLRYIRLFLHQVRAIFNYD